MVPETRMVPDIRVFHAADGEDLVILSCTIFDWSTCVTDGQMDEQRDRQTDRIAMVKMRKNVKNPQKLF